MSTNKIFLDFDGQVVSDSFWTNPTQKSVGNGGNTIHAPVYNIAGDADYDMQGNALPFSQDELKYIEMAWKLVAEDYAPFNVDVTTEEPPLDYFTNSATNGGHAVRVIFSSRYDDARLGGTGNNWVSSLNQTSGISALNSWNASTTDRPAWVFANGFDTVTWTHPDTFGAWGPIQEYAGTIASHEVGHAFGLDHDRDTTKPFEYPLLREYYGGRPGAGDTSWGAIMGGSELRTLTQWSKGEYDGATNLENDLATIAGATGVGYRADDHGNSLTTSGSTLLTLSNGNFAASGIIGGSTGTSNGNDVDVFRFNVGSTPIDIGLYVKPMAVGPNLDIELKLYSASGTLLDTINEPDRLDATYHFVGSGEYYVRIDGVGKGDPYSDGYSDYGSLGQYTLLGSVGIPRITNVTISGSTSTHAPYAFNGPDDSTDVDGSGQRLVTVPVGGADTVEITFGEPVANLLLSHLSILGLRYGFLPTLATTNGFVYTPATHTATWKFSAPLAPDQYLISISDAIVDSVGNHLDGDWVNPKFVTTQNTAVSRFPSGNGVAGGNFNFVFSILPGDASLNNVVNSDDYYFYFLPNYGKTFGANFTQGDFNGNGAVTMADAYVVWLNMRRDLTGLALADWNNDGTVNSADYNLWQHYEGTNVSPWTLGDATGDGLVDNTDYQIWVRQYGLNVIVAV